MDIRLDQFLANVGLSADEDLQIRGHLKTFSKARLSNWLPWLTSKAWTRRSLLHFMQFHKCWEATPDWWESRWYMGKFGWVRSKSSMSNILKRDDAYWMVHHRVDHSPEEVVSDVWFEEWNYYSLWRYGFLSFATFAKFRSGLNEDEEWKNLISWRNPVDDSRPSAREDRIINWMGSPATVNLLSADGWIPPFPHASNLTRWYMIQDWHPEHEWHDNLGWNIPSIGMADSDTPPEISEGPMWPIGGRNE